MISIESYRTYIKNFAFTAQKNVKSISKSIAVGSNLSSKGFSQLLKPVRFLALFTFLFFAIPKSNEMTYIYTPLDFLHFSRSGVFVPYLNMMYCFQDPNYIFLKNNCTLLLSGDIELNPGPNTLRDNLIEKSVQGTFHQGSDKFLETAGIQCSSNCFYAICYAHFRKLSLWKSHDLDYILEQGDRNFKKLGIRESPFIDQFSKVVEIGNSTCTLEFNILDGHFVSGDSISVNFVQKEILLEHAGAVLVIDGSCLGIMHYTTLHNTKFFLFDSHSRNSEGHRVPGDLGTSVLLKFNEINEIKQYIRSVYKEKNLFQIIYVNIHFEEEENVKRFISRDTLLRQKRSQMKRSLKKIEDTKKHQQVKEKKRKIYQQDKEKIRKVYQNNKEKISKVYQNNKEKISKVYQKNKEAIRKVYLEKKKAKEGQRVERFKEKKQEGPYYICVSCNRCLYKRSVVVFKEENYDINFEALITPVTSFDGNFYVCNTCHKKLERERLLVNLFLINLKFTISQSI